MVGKGTIEISLYERDKEGKLTDRKRSFSTKDMDKLEEFYNNNKPSKQKKRKVQ